MRGKVKNFFSVFYEELDIILRGKNRVRKKKIIFEDIMIWIRNKKRKKKKKKKPSKKVHNPHEKATPPHVHNTSHGFPLLFFPFLLHREK